MPPRWRFTGGCNVSPGKKDCKGHFRSTFPGTPPCQTSPMRTVTGRRSVGGRTWMSRESVPVTERLHTTGICLFPLRPPISGGHAGVCGGGSPRSSTIDRMDDRYCSRRQTLAPAGRRFVSIPWALTHRGRRRKRRRNEATTFTYRERGPSPWDRTWAP